MKTTYWLKILGAGALVAAIPAVASAHPGHGGFSLAAGLAHPFTGADHMLAMVGVGLWAALRGGKAVWAWPAAFMGALLAGYALGQSGVALPMAEPTILASIIVLGALTAADARVPTAAGIALIAVFGAAHGYAHGAEAPRGTLGFPLGMAVSTLALHVVGIAASLGLQRLGRPILVRVLGAGAVLGGLALAVVG
jgi:urease accessory protein